MSRRLTVGILMMALGMAMFSTLALATVVGSIHGVIHDPHHRPVQNAQVIIKSKTSDWRKDATTDANGEFLMLNVPVGEYTVSVTSNGFAEEIQTVLVESGTQPVLHYQLSVASVNKTVVVSGAPEVAPTDTATPITLIDRNDIERTPGASRTNSLAAITDYVPGAYFAHDQLHVRGGHQTSWLLDGIPLLNTAIGVNVGPQVNPNDIDYLEANRGSYGAEYGDRTYGVFNISPRTGFERNNEGELVVTAGNFYSTDENLSFGSHTENFAYYLSLNGNRSNLGLQPPIPQVVHDAENGYGGFGSFIYNVNPANQLRLVTSLRRDYYQIPFDPNPNDIENGAIAGNNFTPQFPSIGLRDGQHEADAGLSFSWVHTFNPNLLLTISPLYHYNSGNYSSLPTDTPIATTEDRASTYAGGQATVSANFARNYVQTGFFGFYQWDSQLFGALFNDGSGNTPVTDSERPRGNQETFFLDEKFTPVRWLTLIAGLRPTRFAEGNFSAASVQKPVDEAFIDPRFGVTLTVPKLRWTFRAFYGHYYQAPPLETVSGPALIGLTAGQGLGFIPLQGERDLEKQAGVSVPFHGWYLDADTFRTSVVNFLDHNNIGASSIFFPITVSQALIRAWEVTLRSPLIAGRERLHLAYSNQIAQGSGLVTGGLTNFGGFPQFRLLDHDQRNTLNVGGDMTLPWRSYASTNVYYGSGFSNAFPGQPFPGQSLPAHTTFDLSLGKNFGERFSASVTALNVANRRFELDNSITFGGFHWNNPREIYGQIRYRFHY
jgi:hypothetical protein